MGEEKVEQNFTCRVCGKKISLEKARVSYGWHVCAEHTDDQVIAAVSSGADVNPT